MQANEFYKHLWLVLVDLGFGILYTTKCNLEGNSSRKRSWNEEKGGRFND